MTAVEISRASLAEVVDRGRYEARVETARAVLRWAAATFGDRLTVATSMGDVVLPHLIGSTVPEVDLFFIDTGFHFPETLGTRDAYATMFDLRIRTVAAPLSTAQQEALYGPRLHDRDPDLCCALRKVEPLSAALAGYTAWVSGVRRGETDARREVSVVDWDERRGMVKVNPLADWSDEDVARYVAENDVFENPLASEGYGSIGCAPCTRPLRPGESARDGRWSGRDKTECGLHI